MGIHHRSRLLIWNMEQVQELCKTISEEIVMILNLVPYKLPRRIKNYDQIKKKKYAKLD